ncbi:MAG TPA: hypothetical protein VLE73_04620 [Candidatus Saccharimonadales bacterium]|nr:hypothetical protein [Candidatus Saccharimonadales bacterium]
MADSTASSPTPDDDTTAYDDAVTSKVIDEIVAKEGDTVLAAEDEKSAHSAPVAGQRAKGGRLRVLLHSKAFWWSLVLLLFAGAGVAAALPVGRYWILNMAGVQSGASVITTDDVTGLPVKGVTFTIGGKSAETDESGNASVAGLRLGKTRMSIEQPGYATITQEVTVGWGSNPLGSYKLKAAGVSYTIQVKDYISEKPLQGVQAASGDSNAVSDKNGKITLNLPGVASPTDTVQLSKDGYRSDEITLQPDPKQPTQALLVLNKKVVYASKQNGTYDIYKSDLDGKNAQVLLKGTGSETSNISLATSPDGTKAAVVAARDNKRDSEGALLNTLVVVAVDSGDVTVVTRAAQIQLVDWIGSRLIFEQVSSDPATPPANRYTVVGYNTGDNTRVQLAAATRLNAVFSAQGAVYYAAAANPSDAAHPPAFYKINPDGTGRQTLIEAEVWSGQRVAYDTLNLQTADGNWLDFTISSDKTTNAAGPSSFVNRLYVDNIEGSKSLWVDTQDGQGKLQARIVQSGKEKTIVAQGGLTYPVYWLTDTLVVYRVVLGTGVADYAVSLDGGSPHKITDVVNTYGFSSGQ